MSVHAISSLDRGDHRARSTCNSKKDQQHEHWCLDGYGHFYLEKLDLYDLDRRRRRGVNRPRPSLTICGRHGAPATGFRERQEPKASKLGGVGGPRSAAIAHIGHPPSLGKDS